MLIRFSSLALVIVFFCQACTAPAQAEKPSDKPRNIILLIGDGMGPAYVKAYRYYADNPETPVIEPLPFDRYLKGAIATDAITLNCTDEEKTDCVRDPYGITDSASSASAYATGEDTLVGRIGISVDGQRQTNISEKAKPEGFAIGVVATSQVTHATPAAFYAHVEGRSSGNSIADQLFDNQWQGEPVVDVALGGGTNYLQREDRDLVAEFAAAGYTVASNREELMQTNSNRILGLFAPIGLPRAWDRPDTTPSLADMTQVALKALEQNQKGFFLMVEGSQIDWAGHSNDIVGVISEMEDFSSAIKVALDYAAIHSDTLVVITADHETGGLSMARDDLYQWDPRPMRGMEMTPAGITQQFLAGDESLSVVTQRNINFELTEEERKMLDEAKSETPPYAEYGVDGTQAYTLISLLFDKRTWSGWTSLGHTGVDVPLYAVGPGSEKFQGVLENEDLGKLLQDLLLDK